jgi:hypothetical protein
LASPSEVLFPTMLLLEGSDSAVQVGLLLSDKFAQRP